MGQMKWVGACAVLLPLLALRALWAQEVATNSAEEKKQDPFAASAKPEAAKVDDSAGEARRRIEHVLAGRLREPLEFVNQPLAAVASILSETYEIPIVFDTAALDAVAVSPDTEVHFSINNVTLKSALDLLLKSTGNDDLTYIVDHEVLLITTREVSENRMAVQVYRVDDFPGMVTRRQGKGASASADYHPMIDLIVRCVEPDSWNENGRGNGALSIIEPGILVVRQTAHVHQEIKGVLEEMRGVRRQIEADRDE